MIFAHTYQWIIDKSPHTGERKTQTRRPAIGAKVPRYEVGKTYAVQPGRGKKAVGRIRIKRRWLEITDVISHQQAMAEGFRNRREFLESYERINGTNPLCWAYEFELVKGGE
jgi:hypothetical protein